MGKLQRIEEKRRWLKERIAQRTAAAPLQLSYQQKSLWFMYMLAPESPAYNVLYVASLRRGIDARLLGKAVEAVIQRHHILRTAYGQNEQGPWQCVSGGPAVCAEVIDAAGWSEEALERYVEEEADRRFALEDGENMRVRIIRNVASYRGETDLDVLHLAVHHIAVDFWSLELLLEEICAAYARGTPPVSGDAQPMASTYAQFVNAQQRLLAGEKGRILESYWLEKLRGVQPSCELPTDFGRTETQTYAGVDIRFGLAAELTRKLTGHARTLGVTPFALCLSAFYILLHKYTGRRDLVIGTPTIGRSLTDARDCLGYYANPVPLRVALARSDHADDFSKKVYRTLIEALEHQDYPFALLVDKLGMERDPARSPLFQLSFVWDQPRQLSRNGLSVIDQNLLVHKLLRSEQRGSASDLTLTIFNKGGPLNGMVRYNTALFKTETIDQLIGHYREILYAIAEDTPQRIAHLNHLTPEERRLELAAADPTDTDTSGHTSIVQLFEQHAARAPAAPAIEAAGLSLNYGELHRRVDRTAGLLRHAGVASGDPVGVLLERSVDSLAAFLGCLKAGAVYVPLDPSNPDERLQELVRQSDLCILLTTLALRGKAGAITEVCLDADDPPGLQDWTQPAEPPLHPLQPAYMIFTSGSTGTPKGVLLGHGSLINLTRFQDTAFAVDAESRILQFAPINFDLSVADFVLALGAGASLLMLSDSERRNADAITGAIQTKGITHAQLPASILAILPQVPTPSLRVVVIGGDVSSAGVLDFWRSQARVINAYGPTECTVTVTCQPDLRSEDAANIGAPIPGLLTRVLDDELMPVPNGQLGELFLGGTGVALGYAGNPRLTARQFVPDPYSAIPGARLYRSGDTARRGPYGDLHFVGRKDAQLHLRGFRIEPGEIETALRRHPNVHEALVCAMPDTQGTDRLAAFYREEIPGTLSAAELREFALRLLPDHMIPASFIALEQLQLNHNGKIDRKSLPNPFTAEAKPQQADTGPNDAMEEQILHIWRDVLGVDSLCVTDNFFESGGDSILAIQIAGKLSRAGIEASTQQIYRHQSVREFRRHCSTTKAAAKVTLPLDRDLRLAPIQHWFLARPIANRNHFNQFLILDLQPDIEPAVLLRAVEQTMAAHAVFRLRWDADGTPSIAALSEPTLDTRVVDLSDRPMATVDAEWAKLLDHLHTRLDLAQGPVIHAALLHTGAAGPERLALIAHHMYVDAVSWKILIDDISDAYRRISRDGTNGEIPEEGAFFAWTQHLDSAIEPQRRADRARPWAGPVLDFGPDERQADIGARDRQGETEVLEQALDRSVSAELIRLGNEAYNAGMEELVATAYLTALERRYGRASTRLSIETHGRDLFPDLDLKHAVGWFTTQFPVEFPARVDKTAQAYIGTVKETLRQAKARGHEFGILHYLCGEQWRGQMDALPQPFASMNYLGRLDGGLSQFPFQGVAQGGFGASLCPDFERPQRLALDAFLLADRLTLALRFNPRFDSREQAQALIQETLSELEEFAQGSDTAVIYSPSDFPDADLSSDELHKILEHFA